MLLFRGLMENLERSYFNTQDFEKLGEALNHVISEYDSICTTSSQRTGTGSLRTATTDSAS